MHLHAYTQDSYWGAVPHPATRAPAPATAEEKRAIFYGNAARFLELSEEAIARHRRG